MKSFDNNERLKVYKKKSYNRQWYVGIMGL